MRLPGGMEYDTLGWLPRVRVPVLIRRRRDDAPVRLPPGTEKSRGCQRTENRRYPALSVGDEGIAVNELSSDGRVLRFSGIPRLVLGFPGNLGYGAGEGSRRGFEVERHGCRGGRRRGRQGSRGQ